MGSLLRCEALLFFALLPFLVAASGDFEVGNEKGWVLPSSSHDAQFYNHWASKNRFQVGDIVHFKYEKDSVLVVSEAEYDKCRCSRPEFFSNNGDTEFKLDRAGSFYFISGISGHCQRGQKMIIKVLDKPDTPRPSPSAAPAGNSTSSTSSAAAGSSSHGIAAGSTAAVFLTLSLLILGVPLV